MVSLLIVGFFLGVNCSVNGTVSCSEGDINCDGIVDELDVYVLGTYVMYGTPPLPEFADGDINQDGMVEELDVYVLGTYVMYGYPPLPSSDISFSGFGDDVTSPFELEEGISIFELTYTGGSNFIIWAYNVDTGEREELIVNEIGSYYGKRIVGVSSGFSDVEPGEYVLEVTATGYWEVTIDQAYVNTASGLPQSSFGFGADVPDPFYLESGNGLVQVDMHHNGSSNFIIWLYNINGELEDLLVNEIGSYDGSTIVYMGGYGVSSGIYYINVEADGNWNVDIQYI